MDWNSVIVAVGSNAIVLGVLAFLAKSLINHLLDKDVRQFQKDLEQSATREIESFKSNLEIERIRLQISYGGIFEKQAQAILETYRSILDIEQAASDAINLGGTNAERRHEFGKAFSVVRQKYFANRILLPPDIDEGLAHFTDRMFRSILQYTSADERRIQRMSDEEIEKFFEKQEKAAEIVESELPPIRERLINRMRETIGVHQKNL
jgi:hypothetical protein